MQTRYCELFEWSLILQERCCLSSMHFQTLSGCLQSPSGGWQYCGSTSLCSTPAHPLAKAPQNAHLEMVLSEWKSPMSVLHAAAKIFCLTWFVCVCVCVCVCVLNACVCVYVFAANQEMPFYCWESKSSLTPTASSPLHTDPCLPLAPSLLLLSISPLVAQSSFVCLFLFSRYASLISSLGAFAWLFLLPETLSL